jgi:lipopolysaccharide/colanic/teichoic acid biosynthesis glycosyltransferase
MEGKAVRVLMLTQWFDPEPAFKGLNFAQKLRERGHEVEVLTGFPNYPAGKLYPDYRLRMWRRELMEGIPVIRVPLYPSHDRSILRRALNYASFAVAAAMLGPWLIQRPDVIYVYHPPGTIGMPALLLKRLFGAPVIYDVQDLWPDTIASSGMVLGGLVFRLLDRFCKFVYRTADRVVVLSPGFRRALLDRGVSADKVDVIYNWAPESSASVAEPTEGEDGSFKIIFAGNMGPAQNLDVVLDAAAVCLSTLPNARFLLVGGGVEADRLRQRARDCGLTNVHFAGWQSPTAIQKILQDADTLLVHLKDDPLFSITIPSKTQAYLAAGRPIVMAVRGDAAGLIEKARAGVLAEPGNPRSIADAIRQLAALPPDERAAMGRRGRDFYKAELSMDRGVARFDAVFRSTRPSPRPLSQVYRRCGKRFVDVIVSATALLLLLPLFAAIALAIRLTMGGPVFFRQDRPGKDERILKLRKFRTMSEARDETGALLPDRDRVTKLGRLLRGASLDELPELWNVLTGDLSLVGPRPLLVEYLAYYSAEQRRRHELKPGITGLAQVSGRNGISWDERLRLDVHYVEHCSLGLDCRIILRTIGTVLAGDGGTQAVEALGRFRGSRAA